MNSKEQINPRTEPQLKPASDGIKINGYEQVIEMLSFADPAFRESLLKRIAQRDPQLATNLRRVFKK